MVTLSQAYADANRYLSQRVKTVVPTLSGVERAGADFARRNPEAARVLVKAGRISAGTARKVIPGEIGKPTAQAMHAFAKGSLVGIREHPAEIAISLAIPPAIKGAGLVVKGVKATRVGMKIAQIPKIGIASKTTTRGIATSIGAAWTLQTHKQITAPVFTGSYKDGKTIDTTRKTLPDGSIEVTEKIEQIPITRKPTRNEMIERVGGVFSTQLAPLAISGSVISRGIKQGKKTPAFARTISKGPSKSKVYIKKGKKVVAKGVQKVKKFKKEIKEVKEIKLEIPKTIIVNRPLPIKYQKVLLTTAEKKKQADALKKTIEDMQKKMENGTYAKQIKSKTNIDLNKKIRDDWSKRQKELQKEVDVGNTVRLPNGMVMTMKMEQKTIQVGKPKEKVPIVKQRFRNATDYVNYKYKQQLKSSLKEFKEQAKQIELFEEKMKGRIRAASDEIQYVKAQIKKTKLTTVQLKKLKTKLKTLTESKEKIKVLLKQGNKLKFKEINKLALLVPRYTVLIDRTTLRIKQYTISAEKEIVKEKQREKLALKQKQLQKQKQIQAQKQKQVQKQKQLEKQKQLQRQKAAQKLKLKVVPKIKVIPKPTLKKKEEELKKKRKVQKDIKEAFIKNPVPSLKEFLG